MNFDITEGLRRKAYVGEQIRTLEKIQSQLVSYSLNIGTVTGADWGYDILPGTGQMGENLKAELNPMLLEYSVVREELVQRAVNARCEAEELIRNYESMVCNLQTEIDKLKEEQ